MKNSGTLRLFLIAAAQLISVTSLSLAGNAEDAPSPPQGLAAASGNGQATLTWKGNTEPDFLKYLLYMGSDSILLALKDSTTASPADTTKTITGLTNGTRYYFRVSALDSARQESEKSYAASTIPLPPFSIISTMPAQNALNVDSTTVITITFNDDVNLLTLSDSSIKVTGSLSGSRICGVTYIPGAKKAVLIPDDPFMPGEAVTVMVTSRIASINGDSLAHGYVWQFRVKSAAASGDFFAGSSIGMSRYGIPYAVVTGDFDGDSDIDLAVAVQGFNQIFVWKNNGHASFTLGSYLYVNWNPRSMAAADYDNDGDIDLAVVNGMDTLSILKNNGNGGFTISSTLTTGMVSWSVTCGDLNGDGNIDLAVTDFGSDGVSIFSNDGNASFTKDTSVSGWGTESIIENGDVDGDGDIDLVVTNIGGNALSILKNDGSGSFSVQPIPSTGSARSIATGDLDGDNDLDLAVVHSSSSVSIFINDGTGNFSSGSTLSTGYVPISVTAADIDGDGDLDLAVANEATSLVTFKKNNGNGTFAQGSFSIVAENPKSIAAGDFDGDGDIDLAVTSIFTLAITILLNEPLIPSAPKSLTAAAGNGQATLKWRKNTETDFLKYRVYMGEDSTALLLKDSTTASRNDTVKIITGLTNGTKYYFRVSALDKTRLESEKSFAVSIEPGATSVPGQINSELPDRYRLAQNYPNPFNPSTVIRYQLPKNSNVVITVSDMLGREVETLVREYQQAGEYHIQFHAGNLSGGIYFYTLRAESYRETRKFVLLK